MGSKTAVILFSGGVDSTCVVVNKSSQYDNIHLLTYDRFGFYNIENSKKSAEMISKKLMNNNFVHRVLNIDSYYKKLCYESYLKNLIRYQLFNLLGCLFCKLSMHWRTIVYCLDNNINNVFDGANIEMRDDPSQNKDIILLIRSLYKDFGIKYSNPVFIQSRQSREKIFFEFGLSPVANIKWTIFSFNKQLFCAHEILSVKTLEFLRKYQGIKNNTDSTKNCERKILALCKSKTNFIKNCVIESKKNLK